MNSVGLLREGRQLSQGHEKTEKPHLPSCAEHHSHRQRACVASPGVVWNSKIPAHWPTSPNPRVWGEPEDLMGYHSRDKVTD